MPGGNLSNRLRYQEGRTAAQQQRIYDRSAAINRDTRSIINDRTRGLPKLPQAPLPTFDYGRNPYVPELPGGSSGSSSQNENWKKSLVLRLLMALGTRTLPNHPTPLIEGPKTTQFTPPLVDGPKTTTQSALSTYKTPTLSNSQAARSVGFERTSQPKPASRTSPQKQLVQAEVKELLADDKNLQQQALSAVDKLGESKVNELAEGIASEDNFLLSLAQNYFEDSQDAPQEVARRVEEGPLMPPGNSTGPGPFQPNQSYYTSAVSVQDFAPYTQYGSNLPIVKPGEEPPYVFPGINLLIRNDQPQNQGHIGAAFSGKVIAADHHPGIGNFAIVQDQASGRTLVYGYLESLDVAYGDQINRGQSVGKVGSMKYENGSNILHVEALTPQFADEIASSDSAGKAAAAFIAQVGTTYGRLNPRDVLGPISYDSPLHIDDVVNIGQLGYGPVPYKSNFSDPQITFANNQPNEFIGPNGPSVSVWPQGVAQTGQDAIVNAKDGIIIIGDGKVASEPSRNGVLTYGRVLTGNALPVSDEKGIIPNRYSLDGHTLDLVPKTNATGNLAYDLVITAPGATDYSNSITIQNFDPDPQKYRFGITLNAVPSKDVAPVYRNFTVGPDGDARNNLAVPNSLMESADPRGMFSFLNMGYNSTHDGGYTKQDVFSIAQGTILARGDGVNATVIAQGEPGSIQPAQGVVKLPDGNYACAWAQISPTNSSIPVQVNVGIIDPTGNLVRQLDAFPYDVASFNGQCNIDLGVDANGLGICTFDLQGTKYCTRFNSTDISSPQTGVSPTVIKQNHNYVELPTGHQVSMTGQTEVTSDGQVAPVFQMRLPQLVNSTTADLTDFILKQPNFLYDANVPEDSVTVAVGASGVINVPKIDNGFLMINNYGRDSVKICFDGINVDADYIRQNIFAVNDIFPLGNAQNPNSTIYPSMVPAQNEVNFNWAQARRYTLNSTAADPFAPVFDDSSVPLDINYDTVSGSGCFLRLPGNQVIYFPDTTANSLIANASTIFANNTDAFWNQTTITGEFLASNKYNASATATATVSSSIPRTTTAPETSSTSRATSASTARETSTSTSASRAADTSSSTQGFTSSDTSSLRPTSESTVASTRIFTQGDTSTHGVTSSDTSTWRTSTQRPTSSTRANNNDDKPARDNVALGLTMGAGFVGLAALGVCAAKCLKKRTQRGRVYAFDGLGAIPEEGVAGNTDIPLTFIGGGQQPHVIRHDHASAFGERDGDYSELQQVSSMHNNWMYPSASAGNSFGGSFDTMVGAPDDGAGYGYDDVPAYGNPHYPRGSVSTDSPRTSPHVARRGSPSLQLRQPIEEHEV